MLKKFDPFPLFLTVDRTLITLREERSRKYKREKYKEKKYNINKIILILQHSFEKHDGYCTTYTSIYITK